MRGLGGAAGARNRAASVRLRPIADIGIVRVLRMDARGRSCALVLNGTCRGSEMTAEPELLPCVGLGHADQ